jgi:serine/threonine-protein kinase
MGAVYLATDTDLHRDVALKILSPELAAKPAALERFRREARHAARLRHENIVTVYEFGSATGTWFLALEFVDGIDLSEYINRKGRLDPAEAVAITVQAVKALEHAHLNGIVHRDIKPSNFLLKRQDDKLLVKLSDFGLAHAPTDDATRVTTDGTTVGTVDYISPEQARDSRQADIRSDIYSLGCTLYHMLVGHAPFHEGGIAERLYKHMQEEPPDLRAINPRVPKWLAAVLSRMLAKNPDDRHQTPTDLLADLVQLGKNTRSASEREGQLDRPVLSALAGLADEAQAGSIDGEAESLADDEPDTDQPAIPATDRHVPRSPERRRSGDPAAQTQRGQADTTEQAAAETEMRPQGSSLAVWVLTGSSVLLAVALVVLFLALRNPRAPSPVVSSGSSPTRPTSPDTRAGQGTPPQPVPADTAPRPTVGPIKPPPVPAEVKTDWPVLYQPTVPVDQARLWAEILAPWSKEGDPPADTPVQRIGRLLADKEPALTSLEAAWSAAQPGRLTIIEIHDNGPLFLSGLAARGRSLLLRAGKGYRPLLVWEPGADAARPFLEVGEGGLTLEGLDVVVKWTDLTVPARPCLLRVTDGDFTARDCTFSVAGKHPSGVGLLRFARSNTTSLPSSSRGRCRLSRCYARGASLVALDLDYPGAEVLLESCLLVGGEQSLVQVAGRHRQATVLRVVRSTFVSRQGMVLVQAADESLPQLRWSGWDVLLARGGGSSGGEMVTVAGGRSSQIEWQAVNCLYAGWKTLLKAVDATVADIREWHIRWRHTEGDQAVAEGWPAALPFDPAETRPADYCPGSPSSKSPVGYAATSGKGPLGCDLHSLPPARDNWLAMASDGFLMPPVDLPSADTQPEVPTVGDRAYHGGDVDLAQVGDLGDFLDRMRKTAGLGPRVVLRLQGSGQHKTRPLRVKGSTLVLYFPLAKEGVPPLVLVPQHTGPIDADALIDVEDGSLEMVRAEISYPDYRLALLPAYLLKVRGGDLRLVRCRVCRLPGPLNQGPDSFRGLIHFTGSGDSDRDRARVCALNQTLLVSGKTCLHMVGGGAKLQVQQCVLLSGGALVHLEPGTAAKARMNLQCALENATLAAQQAVVHLADAPHLSVPVEPVVLQARSCAFLNPFAALSTPPLLLAVEGNALNRGLLLWQGEGNAFDKRLIQTIGLVPLQTPSGSAVTWLQLWGRSWDQRQVFAVPLTQTLDWEKLRFDRLVLPRIKWPGPEGITRSVPGADLSLLGLIEKGGKPPR